MKTKAWIALIPMLLSGCGLTQSQRQGVQAFAQATAILGQAGQDEFVLSRKEVVQINEYRLELGVDAVDLSKMDGSFTVERVQVRVAALQALQDYGDMLSQLAGKDLNKDFGEAVGKFTTSLRSVKGIELSEEKSGAITRIATSIGGLFIEAARADAVRRIVEETSPFVQKLALLVKSSFDDEQIGWSTGYYQAIENIQGDINVATNRLAVGVNPARTLVAEASACVEKSRLRFDESSRCIKEAAGRLIAAERDLKQLLARRDFTTDTINDYTQSIKQLVQAAQILEK